MSLQKEVAYFPVYKNTHSLKGWLSSIFKAMDYCITKGLSKCHCMKESRLVLAEAVLEAQAGWPWPSAQQPSRYHRRNRRLLHDVVWGFTLGKINNECFKNKCHIASTSQKKEYQTRNPFTID